MNRTTTITWRLRASLAAALLALAFVLAGEAAAQGCANPGANGPGNISGVVNTYFPPSGGNVTIGPGSTSVSLGTARGAAATPAPGDLFVIIQMQCASINSTDSSSYGDGVAGDPAQGYTDPAGTCLAGRYQFVRAGPATNATALDLSATPLTGTYVQAAAGGGQGRRSFQIVRVLQYSSATLTGTVTASAWDGGTGGVVVLDVAGALNWNGQGINVTGLGFRGGAGRNRPSGDATLTNPYVTTDASGRHASKGEGIAGTPRYVHNDTNPTDTDRGTLVDNGAEGYPNGDFGRGAPGNAGGGGATVSNSSRDNGGGGGGGNGAAGGYGAYGWRSAGWGGVPPSYAGIDDLRGAGGAAFGSASSARLVLGGGGGAGDGNNNTDDPIRSSGGAGGGLVMVRAGSIGGAGTISADGARAPDQPGNDAAGGGGAGGSVLVIAQNNTVGSLTVNARGGRGGDSYITGNVAHGGGGGGSGGVVYTSGAATSDVSAGAPGNTTTTDNPPGGATHGGSAGSSGAQGTVTAAGDSGGAIAGARCLPQLTVTKQTVAAGPLSLAPGTNVVYRIVVTNAAGRGAATGLAISDALPGTPSAFTNQSATPTVTLAGGATRPSSSNAAVGATTPAWSSFTIPGGGSVQLEFTVNIPANVTAGTYQNPATATYADPTRTTAGGTTTASYDPASSTAEDVTVTLPTIGTPLGAGCPAGLFPVGANLTANGSFATGAGAGPGFGAAGFTASVTNAGDNNYPADTTVAVQSGAKNYQSGAVAQSTFPGDGSVPAANGWLYGNGNGTGARYTLWQQTVSGLTANTTYTFFAYVSNAQNPTTSAAVVPSLQLWLGAHPGGTQVTGTFAIANETTTVGDTWTRVQWTFTTGAGVTSAVLSLRDGGSGTAGDDLAVTQASLYACQSRTVSGFVYRDANANGSRDGGETWSAGVNVRVKLTARTGTTCTGSALQNILVGAGAGAYSFTGVTPGDYCIVLNTAAGNANIAPSPPAGWFFTNPDTGVWYITVGIGGPALNFDFGLLNTARIGGRVFRDNGAPSGTANDGIQNGAEPGLPAITVTLTNCAATTYAAVQTDANGDYDFAVPAGATTVCVVETNEGDHRSTGASVGTTALPSGTPTSVGGTSYTYNRTTDTLSFTVSGTTNYVNLNFGDVPDSSFTTNGTLTGAPGTTLYYPHTFTAGSAGAVTFSTTAAANPNIPGWSEVFHRDLDCDGQFDAGEPLITGAIALTAGQQVCILVKEFIPATAPVGGENTVTVTASFSYTGASPALGASASRVDLTIVAIAGLTLVKSVSVATALPGAVITYTITYTNNSASPLSTVAIRDATPAFTTFVAASCGSPPAGLACTVPAAPTTAPAVGGAGSIIWNFTGSLTPGATSAVTFQVQVNN